MRKQNSNDSSVQQNDFLGMSAASACVNLVRMNKLVRKVKICFYKTPPLLQQRIAINKKEDEIIKESLIIREDVKIPFWEALFATCLRRNIFTDALLDAALFHQGSGRVKEINREDVLAGKLVEILNKREEGQAIGLLSDVELISGDNGHFLFLDFHCDVSEGNTRLVNAINDRLLTGGYLLLDSGHSYHAWGTKVVSSEERIRILGRSLFFMPIVDGTYIAHQLIQNASSIRLSIGGQRKCEPRVIAAQFNT